MNSPERRLVASSSLAASSSLVASSRLAAVLLLAAALLLAGPLQRVAPAPVHEQSGSPDPSLQDPESYRGAMRELVVTLSAYARRTQPGFLVVPQNGLELLTEDGAPGGRPVPAYLEAIDGVGQEELFYGYPREDRPTPPENTRYLLEFLRLAREEGKRVLVIDYCTSSEAVDDSYRRNALEGFLSFAAPRRELDAIPPAAHDRSGAGAGAVRRLAEADSFLYLINPEPFPDPPAFLRALAGTRYDLVVVDAFVEDPQRGSRWLTAEEVGSLQRKTSGARRLVLAYLSVGEAESYRFYWRRAWDRRNDGVPDTGAPRWLERGNPRWPGNYKVRYWDPQWQAILFGARGSYLDEIMARGFDGVYLDLVDAYLYYE